MKNLVRIKIIFCLIIIIAFQDIAQVRDLDREILVYIQPGFFELPKDIYGQVTFEKIETASQEISQIIQDNNILIF